MSSAKMLRAIPLGERMPDNPHAVSVSLPSMQDVIAYEEKEPRTMAKVCSGYPRFVRHPMITELAQRCKTESGSGELLEPFFFSSNHALEDALSCHPELASATRLTFCGLPTLMLSAGSEAAALCTCYLQHTGSGISSREAEDILAGGRDYPCNDSSASPAPGKDYAQLENWFAASEPLELFPCRSGMNASYAAVRMVNEVQKNRGRKHWIAVGWLYLDTLKILEQYLESDAQAFNFYNVADIQSVLDCIEAHGSEIAGLFLEAPTNPLVQTPDVQKLTDACRRNGILTVMDPSLASPRAVDLSPYCDLLSCSLTKYAAWRGDIMIGALGIRRSQPLFEELRAQYKRFISAPYERDFHCLLDQLTNASEITSKIQHNALALADYFQKSPKVKELHWAYHPRFKASYQSIERMPQSPGGVMTLHLAQGLESLYDPLAVPKGPSFGVEFTLVTPYLHLAHFDMLNSEEGRNTLLTAGLFPDMLRISIGTESIDDLIRAFSTVF